MVDSGFTIIDHRRVKLNIHAFIKWNFQLPLKM